MASDRVTYTITQETAPAIFCVTTDTVVVRYDGSFALIKAGTLIAAPVPDVPLKIELRKD